MIKKIILFFLLCLTTQPIFAQNIAVGLHHTLAIRSDGSLWAWGDNEFGQLGDGTKINSQTPIRIGNSNDWKKVFVYTDGRFGPNKQYYQCFAIKNDGSLWAWGNNTSGKLGDGSKIDKFTPTRIGTSNDWETISVGFLSTIGLKSDGSLWAWGINVYGFFGNDSANSTTPIRIGTDTNWESLTAGLHHVAAIKTDGSLWIWGQNDFGSGTLGLNWPISVSAYLNTPTRIGNANDWKTVSAGDFYTLAIKDDGTLWAWGKNDSGQLGDGTTINRGIPIRIGNDSDWEFTSVASGSATAIKKDGSLWAWGKNEFGQLGEGTTIDKLVPTKIQNANDWRVVITRGGGTRAIKNDGSLWVWGANSDGQLGDGTNINQKSPLKLNFFLFTPAPTSQASQTLCDQSTLSALSVNGTDIQWYETSSGGQALASTTKLENNRTYYASQIFNGLESTTRFGVTVTLSVPIASITASGPTAFCSGASVTLTANSGSSYLWSNGATTRSISVNTPGNYSVTVTNANGCSVTSVATEVTLLPRASITASGPTTFCQGLANKVILTANEGTAYLWANGATTRSIEVISSGNQWVDVTNSNGCTTRAFITTTVTVDNSLSATISASGSTTICQGSKVILTASEGSSYLWSNGATTRSIEVSTGGNYSVWVTNANGCSARSPATIVTVTQLPNLFISPSGPTTFCAGDAVLLTASTDGSYLWSNGATTKSINASIGGNYTVTVTYANGCSNTSPAIAVTVNQVAATITASGSTALCEGGKVTLTSSEGSSYLWNTGATTRSIEVSTAGNYTVRVSNSNGCSATSTATAVTVNSLPTATITASGATTFCQGDKVTLTSSEGSSYLWSTGATTRSIDVSTSGNYTVRVSNANGCSATSTATMVRVNALAMATITAGGPTSFCLGGKVTLTASSGSSYLWSTGATTQSIEVSTSGNYTVRVTNSNGCSATSAATTVTVSNYPVATITAGGPTTITQTGNVVLSVNTGTGLNYQWIKNGVAINAATASSYTATTGGSYTVKVSNAAGCETLSSAMVIKSVLVLPANNYQINIQGETCRTSDNGKIAISAVQNLNYTATLSKSGQVVKTVNFNTNADLTGLSSGNYTLCITVAGQTEYKQCFDLTITEPLDLSVYSKVNPTNNTIDLLMSGGDTYYITINGEKYTSYTSKMSVGLKAGLNKITVNSSQICQGVFTEEIYVDEKIQAYPNPFSSILNLKIQNQENKELLVRVVDRYGLSVYEAKHLVINNLVTLDLSKLDNDYYFIVIGKQTFKVIKQ